MSGSSVLHMNTGSMKKHFWLLALLLVAFFVRVFGIIHDLPFTYFGDEEHFINRSVAFGSGDLNPHWFHKPAWYMYLLFFEYGMYFLIGNLLGWFSSVEEFTLHYFSDMEPFLLIGRMTTVLFSLATIYLTYHIGKIHENRRVGLIAGLFLALCVGNFLSSIVVKADVPATFFAMLSLFFIFRMYEQGKRPDYLLAGLFAGLGMATKYYPITMVVPMFVAHFLYKRKSGAPLTGSILDFKLVAGFFSLGIGFFAGSPYNLLDPTWIKQIVSRLLSFHKVGTIDREGGFVSSSSIGLWEKIESILVSIKDMGLVILDVKGMSFLVGVLALVGLLYFVINRTPKRLLCLSYVWSFVLVASLHSPSYASSRHLSMVYPILCLIAAVVVERGFSFLYTKIGWVKYKSFFLMLICGLLIFPGAFLIVRYDYRGAQKDTRLLAKEWVERNIPAGTKVLLEESGPKLQMSRENLQNFYQIAKNEAGVGPFTTHLEIYYHYLIRVVEGKTYDITEIYHPWWVNREFSSEVTLLLSKRDRDHGNPLKARGVMPLEYYQQNGFEYVITDSSAYAGYFDEKKGVRFTSIKHFYRELFEKGRLVKEFNPHSWHRPGPTVKIFRIRHDRA